MRSCSAPSLVLSLLALVLAGQAGAAEPAPPLTPEQETFFETRIRPVLTENCFSCHGPQKQKAGLRLDSRAAILQGSNSTAVLIPGQPDKSPLIQAIRHEGDVQMPPDGKLPDAAIEAISHWVKMGAPWPAGDASPQTQPASDTEIERARREHWAFRPVRTPAPASVKNESWCTGDIDRFVLARLESKGLAPSARAGRRTLIRRATFDLHGLPPTAAEIEAFLNDPASDAVAFATLVDRLLASPRYGERWGRHWLDVARYADTKGYVFQEERRFPWSWTYRDFVIRAFNEDLPYDQFIVYQLAADLLPLQDDPGPLAAMGLLTLGRRFINNPHDIIDDRIDVVTRGLLGLTVSCARCHDHKYDPIPTADYYSLYGVFASSTEPLEKPLIGKPTENETYREYFKGLEDRKKNFEAFAQSAHAALLATLRAEAPEYLARAAASAPSGGEGMILAKGDLRSKVVERWKRYIAQTASKQDPVFAPWHALAALQPDEFAAKAPVLLAEMALSSSGPPGKRVNWLVLGRLLETMPVSLAEVGRVYGRLLTEIDRKWNQAYAASTRPAGGGKPLAALSDPEEEALRQVLYAPAAPTMVPAEESLRLYDQTVRTEYRNLRKEIERFQTASVNAPPAAMVLVDAKPVEPHIFLRGNPNNPGKAVPRQFLAVLAPPDRKPFTQGSGRLELARAIASRENPLTARVFVNRVWLHHFGQGLVRTPSDFGMRGEPPTHPELLDYLASQFMENGWSVKKLQRLIMLSSTYQQRSGEDEQTDRLDPENRLLSRMNRRRLDFEAMRDALLAVSGRLDLAMGGPSVDITAPPYPPRRSVYGFIDRQNLPPVLRMFDFASPDTSNAQRHSTTVPQQALFLMNSPFVVVQARHLAGRSELRGALTPDDRISQLYELVFGRAPTPRELTIGLSFLGDETDETGPASEPIVWHYGYGTYDPSTSRVSRFNPFTRFEDQTYGGRKPPPDPKTGWVFLNAEGGHVGDSEHQAIRRWVAPVSGTISIQGTLNHPQREPGCGNGIQAWIVSSRAGELGHYQVEFGETATRVTAEVSEGDTIDFVVDGRGEVSCDTFLWAPVIRLTRTAASVVRAAAAPGDAKSRTHWDARGDFGPPQASAPKPLSAWEQYAQVLLLTNEFVFVD